MMHAGGVKHRGIGGVRLALVALAATLLVTACGEGEIQPPVIHDLSEPWQAAPILLDGAVYTAIEAACRQSGAAQGAALAVIDARGADTAIVVLVGPNSRGECFVDREAGTFGVTSAGAAEGDGVIVPVGPREIANVNISTGERMVGPVGMGATTYLIGQAGADIGSIDLVLAGSGQRIRASLWDSGWFAAWWPGDEETVRFEAVDRNGVPIAPP